MAKHFKFCIVKKINPVKERESTFNKITIGAKFHKTIFMIVKWTFSASEENLSFKSFKYEAY